MAPTLDGQVKKYRHPTALNASPRIIYINGIQTSGDTHERTALWLSQITLRPIIGVYNMSGGVNSAKGFVVDFLQCVGDWGNSFISQLGEFGFDAVDAVVNRVKAWTGSRNSNPIRVADELRKKLPAQKLASFLESYLAQNNRATAQLFTELNSHIHTKQSIVAHSQGNLITANALWALQILHGAQGLRNIQIYSVSSPVPAWPAGINFRIKVYGHKNDLVTYADPKNLVGRRSKGDNERLHGSSSLPWIPPHDISVNFFGTNFVSRIRSDLGLGDFEDSRANHQPFLPGDHVHVVNRGESLSSISNQYFGTHSRWPEIYKRNVMSIGSNPNRISVGLRLIIPAK